MKTIIIIIILVLHAFFCMSQNCNSVLLNTGYDHVNQTIFPCSIVNNSVLPDNPVPDPYWRVVQMPSGGGWPVTNTPAPSFTIDDLDNNNYLQNSQAISFQPDQSLNFNNSAPGHDPIIFERCFTMIESDRLIITGKVEFDDALCITIDNNISVPINYINQCNNPTNCNDPCPIYWDPITSQWWGNRQRYYPSIINYTTPILSSGDHTIQLKMRNLHGNLCGVKFEGLIHSATVQDNFECDPCPNSTLAIRKYFDLNCNEVLDQGDEHQPGWQFEITDPSGSAQTMTTDFYGYIYVTNLPSSGTVTISETNALGLASSTAQFVSTTFGTVTAPGVFEFNLDGSPIYNIAVLNSDCAPPGHICCIEEEVSAIFDGITSNGATYPNNSTSTISLVLNGTGSAYTEVRVNMTAFELFAEDDQGNPSTTCLQCINDALSWASIIKGYFPDFTEAVSTYPGYSYDTPFHNPREIVFSSLTPVPIANKSMTLKILLPGKNPISCCHIFAKITLKVIFQDVDCHECESIITQVIEIK